MNRQLVCQKQIKTIEWQLRGGSRCGMRDTRSEFAYLGQVESLREITDHDMETLKRINKTPREIAAKLSSICTPAMKKCVKPEVLGIIVEIKPFLQVSATHYKYAMACPFTPGWLDLYELPPQAPVATGYYSFEIKNTKLHEGIVIETDLLIHLITDHNFFGGQGSRYRIDPLKLSYVLSIIDYDTYVREKHRERLNSDDARLRLAGNATTDPNVPRIWNYSID